MRKLHRVKIVFETSRLFVIMMLALSFVQCSESSKPTIYDATIAEKEILSPKPGKEPIINGPRIYGARPGKKFVYRIPCQGLRPIKFAVDELPIGLYLNQEKGIITGIVPEKKGEYLLTLRAESKYGTASRPFKLVIGEKLALTPPTGWNTWGGHMIMVSDSLIRNVADIFVQDGLADVGYQYLGIDDCWERITQSKYDSQSKGRRKNHKGFPYDERTVGNVRDKAGNFIPNDLFPDMKALTDYIHSYGLKAGIYSTPGITTCQDFEGSYGHEAQDAKQFSDWGFDFLKYDMCSGKTEVRRRLKEEPEYKETEYWNPMISSLRNQDRDIVFNMCTYTEEPWDWAPSLGVHAWRFTAELNHGLDLYFKVALRLSNELRDFHRPGHWADPDYMYIHNIRDWAAKGAPSKEIELTTNQRYQYVTLWSMICAPFVFSCDMYKIDDFTLRLLSNANVLNINQDELCHVAETVRNEDNKVIMVKELADGSKALAIFNRDGENEKSIKINFKELGLSEKQVVFDVWRQEPLGKVKDELRVKLSPNGVAYFLLSN